MEHSMIKGLEELKARGATEGERDTAERMLGRARQNTTASATPLRLPTCGGCGASLPDHVFFCGPRCRSIVAARCCGEDLASTSCPDWLLEALQHMARNQLFTGQEDSSLYVIAPEADTYAFLSAQSGDQIVLPKDTDASDAALYRAEVAHCTITGQGPPSQCRCGKTRLFVDTGDIGFLLPLPPVPIAPRWLYQAIRAMNVYPDPVCDIFEEIDRRSKGQGHAILSIEDSPVSANGSCTVD